MNTAKLPFFLPALAIFATGPVMLAQAPIPEPEPPASVTSQPVELAASAPLVSLEQQVRGAAFDQRGAFAKAFDQANLAVDAKIAELRARGLTFAEEAETNLAVAREQGRQAFRDLSLTTNETWITARDNAVTATRRIRGALEDLERYATQPQR